ncbi:MAG: metallophosphoesterase family protein [Verrucomicrobia subdivision 3 bacterium]|nr:metallophosphoesterase family protein [Limisphaerales bacterium]
MTRALLAGLVIAQCALGSEPGQHHTNVFARGPYVQLATHHSIFVVWRTEAKITPGVRFGASPDHLDREVRDDDIITRVGATNKAVKLPPGQFRLHSAPEGTYQYEAHITGLQSDTQYYYGVYDGDTRLTGRDPSFHFRTHPIPGTDRPMRFWVVGDSGTGRETQSIVHWSMTHWTKKEKRPLDFYLHVGDMAYSRGRDVEFQTRFFEMYEPTLRNVVCWPAMGNHEGATSKGTNGIGPYYDAYVLPTRAEAGGLASGMEAFYSFDYGRAHFICLDSHDLDRKPTGMMAQWLKADLEEARADWLIAYFHHPPYTKGSHDSDREKQLIEMRTHIMPILESGGIDVVLTGHSHIYERSMLMDGAYATPTVAENVILDDGDGDPTGHGPYRKSAGIHPNEGAIQVVAGHGGTTLRRKGTMPVMRRIIVEHGSVLIDIAGDTLTGTMIDKYGERRDLFSLVKRGTVTPTRLANPWQPEPWSPPKREKDAGAEPPEDFFVVIEKHSQWHYMAGEHPGTNWMKPEYDVSGWKVAEAGFGIGDNDDRTVLSNMRSNYATVYIRRNFEIEQADTIAEIGLMISYDDGFIAYLNGKEVVRVGVGIGSGRNARNIKAHDAGGTYSYFPLKDYEKYLKDGVNVLAIEGHNQSLESSDFTLDPYLLLED